MSNSSMAGATDLPPWAVAGEKRRAHMARVTALLDAWADAMGVGPDERQSWHDAGRWHDALRDAPESALRAMVRGDELLEPAILHGPAAAARLEADGERRRRVLDAIRWHTIGCATWDRTGCALYMADFLEPGRSFARGDRAYLARQVPHDFDGTFRQVVRIRLEWTLRDGKPIHASTVELWNRVR
jgi:HD superfamily phosphohydrolase YqeK